MNEMWRRSRRRARRRWIALILAPVGLWPLLLLATITIPPSLGLAALHGILSWMLICVLLARAIAAHRAAKGIPPESRLGILGVLIWLVLSIACWVVAEVGALSALRVVLRPMARWWYHV